MLRGRQSKTGFLGVVKFSKRTIATFSLLLFSGLLAILFIRLSGKKYPNVILISIDSLRADHLGCYGYSRATSPNIDALAKEGTIFFNAFSHYPKTTESHMSMITSLHPDVHQVKMWRMKKRDKSGHRGNRLNSSVHTLAEILKNHGYVTAGFTCGGNVSVSQGFGKGFNSFCEVCGPAQIQKVISWLKGNYNKRFFLFLHTFALHHPYLPPPPYSKKYYPDYKGTIFDSWEKLLLQTKSENHDWWECNDVFWKNVNKDSPSDLDFLIAQYDAAINYIDNEEVGLLLRELRALNIYKNTLIIITADHGEAFKEHSNFYHEDVFVEVMRVPIIMTYPSVIPQNKTIKQLVRLTDIMPTIFDILGIKTNFLMQGKSLSPAIMKDEELNLSCYSVCEKMKAIRTDRYAFIENNARMDNNCSYLYDRQKDPGEKNNIIKDNPDIADEFKRRLYTQVQDYKRLGLRYKPAAAPFPEPDSQKRLKSLGYLQ